MEAAIRDILDPCNVEATVIEEGIYAGANQAISYSYHGSGSYLEDFEGPDRGPSSMYQLFL